MNIPSDIQSDRRPDAGAGVLGASAGFLARLKQIKPAPKPAGIADKNEVWSWYRGDAVNSIEPGDKAGGDDVASWRARFPGWLAEWYKDPALEQRLQKLNANIQWMSFPNAGDQVAVLQIGVGGATVVDDGRALVVEAGKPSSSAALAQRAALMVAIAQAKGWSTLSVKGDAAFVAAVRAAATDAGLGISTVNGRVAAYAQPQQRSPAPKM